MIRTPEEKAKVWKEFKEWYESSGVKQLRVTRNPEMNPTPEDIMVSIMNSERAIREGRVTRVYELGDKPYAEELRTRTRFDDENPPEMSFSRYDNE